MVDQVARGHTRQADWPGRKAQTRREAREGVAETSIGLFLRCSMRPGQSIRYGGDVCIMGDVETGAEVVAEGDVIIWGALRGVVHAGVGGDDEAVVCALRMNPTQLGIGGDNGAVPHYGHGLPG